MAVWFDAYQRVIEQELSELVTRAVELFLRKERGVLPQAISVCPEMSIERPTWTQPLPGCHGLEAEMMPPTMGLTLEKIRQARRIFETYSDCPWPSVSCEPPDDTQLSDAAWDAKVEAVLADCARWQKRTEQVRGDART